VERAPEPNLQIDKFRDLAREPETDGDKARWDERQAKAKLKARAGLPRE
jgi:hypothetical protein